MVVQQDRLPVLVAAVLLLAFMLVECRIRQPLVDVALVLTRPFANANLCAFAFALAYAVMFLVIPQLAAAPARSGYGLGLTTTQVGLLLVPTSITGVVSGWLGGRVVDLLGPRLPVALGAFFGVGGYASLAPPRQGVWSKQITQAV
jgi:hypothetical protein